MVEMAGRVGVWRVLCGLLVDDRVFVLIGLWVHWALLSFL
jgi:hypothetical protein